jgi:hypothetical protein
LSGFETLEFGRTNQASRLRADKTGLGYAILKKCSVEDARTVLTGYGYRLSEAINRIEKRIEIIVQH